VCGELVLLRDCGPVFKTDCMMMSGMEEKRIDYRYLGLPTVSADARGTRVCLLQIIVWSVVTACGVEDEYEKD
jgi:hypothetical protein